ncbi:MAG TPA: hypothetical protein PKW56_04245 [Clostridiales bacterium]|nr:hypothetical protein [Clostridiales bacterium]
MAAVPDFKKDHTERLERLTVTRIGEIFEKASEYDLFGTLKKGGAVIFPHSTVEVSGIFTAAAVNACLDSGADRILVIGCLHALTHEMDSARRRIAEGGSPEDEESWGIQGPGLKGRSDWEYEFSLLNFQFLWNYALRKKGGRPPELLMRYPFLAGGKPCAMPGIGELEELIMNDTVIVATMDPFHHGIGYGDAPDASFAPESGGLDLARKTIREGLDILESGDHWEYNTHCLTAKSDGRDVGQVLRHLVGPCKTEILGLVADDMHKMYGGISPTWVVGALIRIDKI